MVRKISLAFVMSLVFAFGAYAQKDWARLNRYAEANSNVTERPKAVFMGDSITEGWYSSDPDFFNDNGFLGRGISGQTTTHMLVRMRKDVVNHHPKYVVILAGTNDIAMNNGYISPEDIVGNIVSMCEIAKSNGIRPVICSILPVTKYRWRPEVTDCADIVIRVNAMLKEYASENRIRYVDYHSALKNEENGLPSEYSHDGVHLTAAGYEVIEQIILKVIK